MEKIISLKQLDSPTLWLGLGAGVYEGYTLERYVNAAPLRAGYALAVALGVAVGVLVNTLWGLGGAGDPLSDVKLIWLIYLPVALLSAVGLLAYNPRDDFRLSRRVQRGDYLVVFQVTTRGFNVGAVSRAVRSVLYWAPRYLRRFEVWIVTEDDVDKGFFENLKKLDDRVRVVYVPSWYRTPRGTRYKARALHYAAELRARLGYDPKRTWIYLMDEESIVGEDTILGIIEFIEEEAPKGKLLGQGLIIYSNYWGKNLLASVEDSLRAFDDVSRYRLQLKLGLVIVGVHGSHILFRGDVEAGIGWDFGPVRAEDTVFGLLAAQRYGRVWGWLRGRLYEQSPSTLRDLLRQRRRWFWGTLDIVRPDFVDARFKLVKLAMLASWLSALPSIAVTLINILVPTPIPPGRLNVRTLLKSLPLIPAAAAVEALAPWYALATLPRARRIGFEVITK